MSFKYLKICSFCLLLTSCSLLTVKASKPSFQPITETSVEEKPPKWEVIGTYIGYAIFGVIAASSGSREVRKRFIGCIK